LKHAAKQTKFAAPSSCFRSSNHDEDRHYVTPHFVLCKIARPSTGHTASSPCCKMMVPYYEAQVGEQSKVPRIS
jgi:hypothetical protein